VIHCAGQSCFGRLEDQTLADMDRQLTVNLRSVLIVAHHFLPAFRARGAGTMLFVGSVFGSIGFPGYTAYCASKSGLRGFCEALQREVADSGVGVLYVAPRATATDMNPGAVDAMNRALGNRVDEPEEVAARIIRALCAGRKRSVIGWPEKLFVRINGLLPSVVDRAIRKQLPVIRRFIDKEE
jgi:short-subunit dehydrogenase